MAGESGGHCGELCAQVAVDALADRIEFTMQARGGPLSHSTGQQIDRIRIVNLSTPIIA